VLALDIGRCFDEDAIGQLRRSRCSRCSGLVDYLRLRSLGSEFFAKCVGRDIINRAGSALHLEATTFKEHY
jgi:hypothetical protein